MNTVIEELVQQEAVRKRGEIVELNSLPVLREIIQQELLKSRSQLQSDLREERQRDMQALKQEQGRELKETERHLGDRLAALVIRALREGLISRRMLYALLAKEDPDFAVAAFEDAKSKAGRDLSAKVSDGAM